MSGGAAFLREGAENWRRDLGGAKKKFFFNRIKFLMYEMNTGAPKGAKYKR